MTLRIMLPAALLFGTLAASASAQTPVAPLPGDLAVSEIMFNPGPEVCVVDADGEFFELTNISNKVLDLNDLYIEDRNTGTGLPSGFGFHIPLTAGIAPLYPGQMAVFVRHATNNGPLPLAPTYVYASTSTTPPADKSQVGSTQMMINNTNVDGLFIATGNFASLGGTIVEQVSYNASLTPLAANVGVSAERINLFAAWQVDASNNNSANVTQPLLGAFYGVPSGACGTQQNGTPGSTNSMDATSWIQVGHYSSYNDTLGQNTGTMVPKGPPSYTSGALRYALGGGPALTAYYWGYANLPAELYLHPLLVFGSPGAFLIDLGSASFVSDPSFVFDAAGNADLNLTLPVNPGLVGLTFSIQWLSVDFVSFQIVLSNGLTFTISN